MYQQEQICPFLIFKNMTTDWSKEYEAYKKQSKDVFVKDDGVNLKQKKEKEKTLENVYEYFNCGVTNNVLDNYDYSLSCSEGSFSLTITRKTKTKYLIYNRFARYNKEEAAIEDVVISKETLTLEKALLFKELYYKDFLKYLNVNN